MKSGGGGFFLVFVFFSNFNFNMFQYILSILIIMIVYGNNIYVKYWPFHIMISIISIWCKTKSLTNMCPPFSRATVMKYVLHWRVMKQLLRYTWVRNVQNVKKLYILNKWLQDKEFQWILISNYRSWGLLIHRISNIKWQW